MLSEAQGAPRVAVLMLMRLLLLTHPDADIKKPPTHSCAGGWPAENFVRVRIFLSRTSEKDLGSFSSHRGFLQPRLADLHLAIGVLGMLGLN
jgi:hypothetical protein